MAEHKICPYLQHSMMLTPYAEVRPCCRFDPTVYEESFVWTGENTLEEFYSNGPYAEIRNKASKGEVVQGCHRCDHEESLGIQSMRQKVFPAATPPITSTSAPPVLTTIEVSAGRICNLKCRSCDSFYSTKWDSDAKALQLSMPNPQNKIDWDRLDASLFTHLQSMKVTGGEPCLNPPFFKFIQNLEKNGIAQNIEIELFSNATVPPPEALIKPLLKFKKITISLSVDAVGPQNTYLRHPSQWSEVCAATQKWVELSYQYPQLEVGFAVTVSVYNVLYLFELLNWFVQIHPRQIPSVVIQVVYDPLYMSISHLPQQLRQSLKREFVLRWEAYRKEFYSEPWSKKISKLMQVFDGQHPGTMSVADFNEATSRLDRLRGESFQQVFPELERILSSHPLSLS